MTSQRHYALTDAMGSVTTIADATGAPKQRFSYSAFGQVTRLNPDFSSVTADTILWNVLFHGESYDLDTAWANYGYRYYSPILGKWLSRDPIAERGGNNLYHFTYNNAVNKSDWLGLAAPAVAAPIYVTGIGLGALEAAAGIGMIACLLDSACREAAAEIARKAMEKAACDAQYVTDIALCQILFPGNDSCSKRQRSLCYQGAMDGWIRCMEVSGL